jgi:hypothetical protein
VDATSSGSFPLASFGISGDKTSGSAAIVFVNDFAQSFIINGEHCTFKCAMTSSLQVILICV